MSPPRQVALDTKAYEDGYKRVPEDLAVAEAWEKASLSSFSREEW